MQGNKENLNIIRVVVDDQRTIPASKNKQEDRAMVPIPSHNIPNQTLKSFRIQTTSYILQSHHQVLQAKWQPSCFENVLIMRTLDINKTQETGACHRQQWQQTVDLIFLGVLHLPNGVCISHAFSQDSEFSWFHLAIINGWVSSHLRLAYGVGSGHYGVRHSHTVAANYDSDLIACLAFHI